MALDWTLIAVSVALVSFFIVVVVQMISKAFSFQGGEVWAKSEYMQVGVSFLIIIFAVALQTAGVLAAGQITTAVATASGNVDLVHSINSLPPGSNGDPALIGKAYIGKVIECEVNIYRATYWRNIWVEAVSRVSYETIGSEPVAGGFALSGWVSLLHYIMNNMVYLALYNYIQYNLLVFSQYTMLSVFLPIGLILRAFAPTRGAGGFVTAFSLGFAFVFPMTYVMIVALMPNAGHYCTQISLQTDPPFGQKNPCFNSVGSSLAAYFMTQSMTTDISQLLGTITTTINLLFLQGIFYPLASLIITFSFIRQTGNLFGADLAEIGRGLIKII
ncbi:MAG: hypothetical protein NTV88_04630, partial [Candidatus Micrarchaeota archaeon]|nr:hypothetical protein [Candidatus Micrarchaeota archaeon]